jgi:indole-3-glycerol phosphate synthase
MDILKKIIEYKKVEVEEKKKQTSIEDLKRMPLFEREPLSMRDSIIDESKTGIIAEYKRKSPSKGIINDKVSVKDVTSSYAKYGASGISVLTDENFFGGSLNDLIEAFNTGVPLLRKDFIIDEYQILEAKAYGASVILLIAACLSKEKVKQLSQFAKTLGLEVLLEIHNEFELEYIGDHADMIGINNRNLKNFEVTLDHSIELIKKIPDDVVVIAESGISNVNDIVTLKEAGFNGFLIGEYFMKHTNPSIAFAEFSNQLKAKYEN